MYIATKANLSRIGSGINILNQSSGTMKTGNIINLSLLLIGSIGLGSCENNNPVTDKTAILELLKSETETFAQGNFEEWATHWKQSPDILLTYTMNNTSNTAVGWQQLSGIIKNAMDNMGKVESPNFSREFHTVQIDGNMAWAHFTQTDTLDGIPTRKHESRILERVGKDWKIIGSNIINQSSFAENQYLLNATHVTGKTHIPLNEFPKDMIVNHVEGWGGMTVAINEPPAGTDFAPLLEGLKNNSCHVPH